MGVDCFGPFWVKRARSQVKRYGVFYACLATRAIHLEVAQSMDGESFANSMSRFIARRGIPEVMRSDNGSNFVEEKKNSEKLLLSGIRVRFMSSSYKETSSGCLIHRRGPISVEYGSGALEQLERFSSLS